MAKKSIETGPSIGYHAFSGTPTGEHCTDRSILECIEEGTVTFTFQDDTTLPITVLAGGRYALSSDVKSITSDVEVNLF